MSVKEHYDLLLSGIYDWMTGDFQIKQKEQEAFFRRNNLFPKTSRIAVDLGAGHGLQAISLSNLGFSVKAVDFNTSLLKVLASKNGDIEIIESDLLLYLRNSKNFELITCMGDTIAHLEAFDDLQDLFRLAFQKLERDGKCVISFRDQTEELKDIHRFIPVRSDENKILTCFLEYSQDSIRVTDLLHEKTKSGWKQKISSYNKLRLKKANVEKMINLSGLKIISEDVLNGMSYIIAKKEA